MHCHSLDSFSCFFIGLTYEMRSLLWFEIQTAHICFIRILQEIVCVAFMLLLLICLFPSFTIQCRG